MFIFLFLFLFFFFFFFFCFFFVFFFQAEDGIRDLTVTGVQTCALPISSKWSSRLGVGMGYKTPTLFTEETETIQYKGVAPLQGVRSEKSYGGTADVNFRTTMGDRKSVV